MRLRTLATVLLGSLLCAACADDPPALEGSIVTPVFGDPCLHDPCGSLGLCVEGDDGSPVCLCNPGYGGEHCDRCEVGFHRDVRDRCVTDERCADLELNPCAPYGSCDDSQGVIACECDPGYDGPRCNLCAPGHGRSELGECLQLVLGNGGGALHDGGVIGTAGNGPSITPDASGPIAECPEFVCSGHGTCRAIDDVLVCECDEGYAGEHCTECAELHHRNALERCVPDEICMPNTCNKRGACSVLDGSTVCACDEGYSGTRCKTCAPGYRTDDEGACVEIDTCETLAEPGTITFDGLPGYPTTINTCSQSDEQEVGAVTFTSIAGDGTVWKCAASAWAGVPSAHVMVEAGKLGPAQLAFSGPVSQVSLDYAAYSALTLEVRANGAVQGTISAALRSGGSLTLSLAQPTRVIELWSTGSSTNVMAIDNLTYEPAECP